MPDSAEKAIDTSSTGTSATPIGTEYSEPPEVSDTSLESRTTASGLVAQWFVHLDSDPNSAARASLDFSALERERLRAEIRKLLEG